MRPFPAVLASALVASSGVSGFILGKHGSRGGAAEIPTRAQIVDAMADEVGLDPGQRAAVLAISDRHNAEIQAVRRRVAPDLAAIRSATRAETRALMTDEQQRRFDAYCARRDEQRARADR